MASENETVDEIVKEMRRDAIAADAWCETHGEMASAASVLNRHADRVEAAHRREVEKLVKSFAVYERISESLSFAKKRIETEIADKSKVIQELNDVRELNRKCCDENERLNGEVAELRECLKEAIDLRCGRLKCEKDVCFYTECGKERECTAFKWRKALAAAEQDKGGRK